MINDPFTLNIYLDSNEEAIGYIYDDDYNNEAYQNNQFGLWEINYNNGILKSKILKNFKTPGVERIVIIGKNINQAYCNDDDSKPLEVYKNNIKLMKNTLDFEIVIQG